MAVTTSVVTITPQMAEDLLNANTGNRPLRPSAINRYAADMQKGRWVLNGETILVAEDGMLLDGQNRLSAIVLAGVPVQTVLVTGLNGGAMDTVDIGIPRTLGDALYWKGIPNPRGVATAVTWVYRYDDMVARGLRQLPSAIFSRSDLLLSVEANPGLVGSVETIEGLRKHLPISTGIASFVHYLATRISSKERADQFWAEVGGATTQDGSASQLLRDWLLEHQTPMARKGPTIVSAMAIKGARFWLQGLAPQRLSWKRPNQRKGEEYPRIDTALV